MTDVKLKIYGGTFEFSIAARRYPIYLNTIARALKKFDDAWVEKALKESVGKAYQEAWRDELANLSRAMKTAIDDFSDKAELPGEAVLAIEAMCKKTLGYIEQQGLESDQAVREIAAEGTSFENMREVRLRAAYAVIGQMSVAAEQVERLVRDGLIEDGVIRQPGKKAKGVDGAELFRQLREGEVPAEEKDKVKLAALRALPQNKDLIAWCWADDTDKEPICKLAKAVGVSLGDVRKKAFEKAIGMKDFSSESSTLAFREKVAKAAEELRHDASKLLDEIDGVLAEFDREARTAGGRLFDTREEAALQRKVVEFERGLQIDTEAEALESRDRLRAYIDKLKVDGAWTLDRINRAVERFDLLARTVDEREFPSREEAAKQRELSDCETGADLSTEEAALAARKELQALIEKLGIDGAWKLERVNAAIKCFDETARTAFGVLYDTRDEAAANRKSSAAFFAAVRKAIADSKEEKFYLDGKIPPKKLMGARSYLKSEQDDGVFALLDTTFFGSAKTGLVVSLWGIAWKNDTGPESPRTAFSWAELSMSARPAVESEGASVIRFASDAAYENCGSDVATSVVAEVLVKLARYASEADSAVFEAVARMNSETNPDGSPSSSVAVHDQTGNLSRFVGAVNEIKSDAIFTGNGIPEKKKKNAFASMQVREPLDSIVVLADATVWGSAKDGLVVADKAIYVKNFMSDPVRIGLDEIENVAADKKDMLVNDCRFTPSIFDENVIECLTSAFKILMGR